MLLKWSFDLLKEEKIFLCLDRGHYILFWLWLYGRILIVSSVGLLLIGLLIIEIQHLNFI
jgi:hypothetical protein